MCRRATGKICGSRRAANTASPCPTTAITTPAIHSRSPMPIAAASVPLTIASARGRTGEEDRLCECPVHRCREPGEIAVHQTNAPPPKLKNERKKLDAANAIDRPNTICTNRRESTRRVAERQRQPGDHDDDHADHLGDRPLNRIEDRLQRGLPRHTRAARICRHRAERRGCGETGGAGGR